MLPWSSSLLQNTNKEIIFQILDFRLMIKMVVSSIKLNTGRSIPGVGFGTGTSFFNRGDAVADIVKHAYQVLYKGIENSPQTLIFLSFYLCILISQTVIQNNKGQKKRRGVFKFLFQDSCRNSFKQTMFKSVKNFTFICTVNYNITTLPLIVKKFFSDLLIL